MELNSAPTRCCALPLPELAKSILPGCALAAAISSRTELTFSFCGFTTSAYGPEAMVVNPQKLNVNSDRKSTRLNSSHSQISYAVFCLKKKKNRTNNSQLHVHS